MTWRKIFEDVKRVIVFTLSRVQRDWIRTWVYGKSKYYSYWKGMSIVVVEHTSYARFRCNGRQFSRRES